MNRMLLMVVGTMLLGGCVASGPKYVEVKPLLSPPAPDRGRVFFLREGSMFGAGLQPEISVDGKVVGSSKPGGFFFVDLAAGPHACSTATEVERTLSFSLESGELKYVKSYPTFGVLVGRVNFELLNEAEAEKLLQDLHYTGTPLPPKAEATAPAAPATPAVPAS